MEIEKRIAIADIIGKMESELMNANVDTRKKIKTYIDELRMINSNCGEGIGRQVCTKDEVGYR